MSYSTTVLADSPIAYYQLGETSGTSCADSSGNGNNLTYQNSPTLGVSPLITTGTAVTFSAGSSQSSTGSLGYTGATGLTVEAWIKTTATPSSQQFVCHDTGSSPQRVFQFRLDSPGKVVFIAFINGSGGTSAQGTTVTVNDGAAHHIVGTWNASTGATHCYVDSVVRDDGTQANAGSVQSGGTGFGIATRSGTAYLSGTVDEVAIYGSALSAARILAHYNAGIASAAASLIYADRKVARNTLLRV